MASNNVARVFANLVKPPEVDAFGPLNYSPHAKQKIFHELSRQRVSSILFGGAAGGGKSCALMMESIWVAMNYSGIKVLCVRRTYNELEESFIAELRKRGYASDLGGKWNQTKMQLSFPNGSIIRFTYAENEIDASRVQGGEYQMICVDEATLMAPAVLDMVAERLRSSSRNIPVIGLRLACLDYGDVLTETGWKPIQDVAIGEMVYSTDADGVMELKPVLDVYHCDYDGPMVRVNRRGLKMSMTPNHRVVYQGRGQNRWDAAGKDQYLITPWNEHTNGAIDIARSPRRLNLKGLTSDPLDWGVNNYLAFMGLYLAEGCTNTTVRRSNYKTIITQCKVENQQSIRDLLDHLPYNYCLSANGDFQITNKALWTYLSQFGKAHDKFVPRDILDTANSEQLTLLLKWLVFGDGHIRNGSIQYVTVSKQLADDVSEIGLKLGYRVMQTCKELDDPNHRDRYTVYLSRQGEHFTYINKRDPENNILEVDFSGKVYCIKVADNENFVVRQDGSVWLSGNTNPGGIGSKAIRDKFIIPTNWGDGGVVEELDAQRNPILDANGEPKTVAYVHSKYTDNPYIDAGYEAILNSIADPNRRRAMRDGDWDAMVGAFFPQWTRFKHVIPAEACFTPPAGWQRYCGIDYGIRAPFAAIWGAVDQDARLWLYREITLSDVQAKDQARMILDAEEAAGEINVVRVADPAMWGDRGTPLSIADIYGIEGCGIAKADNNRLTGYARFHSALNDDVACEYHRSLGWELCPMLHVMERGCPGLIEDMPNLPRSKTKPEDSETAGVMDHTIDAARYLIAMAGTSARPVIYNDGPIDPSLLRAASRESRSAFSAGYDGTGGLVSGKFAGTLAPTYHS